MGWKRFATNITLTGSPTEGDDTLGGKTKQERFDEQSCNILREHMDVLSDETLAELPQDATLQHEVDLVPRKKFPVAGASKVHDAFLVFGARLRTELLLHAIRSQPGCGRGEETSTEIGRCQALDAAKLGLAAAPILAVVVQDRPFSRSVLHIRFRDWMRVDDPVHDKKTLVMK
ncbi:LOW QUALITY PROTEIN: hypothetical protein PHMEG_00012528 [Phytophthora megakarya]|uniref:Reverse transcriptase n=1 Tax=Phytophthora megakarya TaxID=4795 RepID=A0A225W8Y7_9STRA|nr:LOW QUALITY PROTEIN: hypothetical protein PHMEG_00012528 [Phytophthora megakarya]